MLVTNRDLLMPAMKRSYAVGAFNISNLENLSAVTQAADEERSPAIIAVTPSSIQYAGLAYVEKMVKTAAESVAVPLSLHLDHGKDIQTVVKCIHSGFTSVMIDGSHLKFEENVALARHVVDLAHPKGISVEAELGRIESIEKSTAEERKVILTDPDAAKTFVEQTGIDALALAIGTSTEPTNSKTNRDSMLKDCESFVKEYQFHWSFMALQAFHHGLSKKPTSTVLT